MCKKRYEAWTPTETPNTDTGTSTANLTSIDRCTHKWFLLSFFIDHLDANANH